MISSIIFTLFTFRLYPVHGLEKYEVTTIPSIEPVGGSSKLHSSSKRILQEEDGGDGFVEREGLIDLMKIFQNQKKPKLIEVQFFSDEEKATFSKVRDHEDGMIYYWNGVDESNPAHSLNLLIHNENSQSMRITG